MRRTLGLLAIAALLGGCGGGGDKASTGGVSQPPAHLRVSSPAFIHNTRLPSKYTCDGAGEEPVVKAGTVPPSTSELVLIVSDADAGGFVHVTRYGIGPRGDGSVNQGGKEGRNSAGKVGWTPPCPPKGDKKHHYVWSVYALRDASGLAAGATPAEVSAALRDGVLASGSITAFYSR